MLPDKFPRVQALVWFNWNADNMDWVIESSPGAQAAFAKGIAASAYRAGPCNGSIATSFLPEVTCASGGCVYLPIITNQ